MATGAKQLQDKIKEMSERVMDDQDIKALSALRGVAKSLRSIERYTDYKDFEKYSDLEGI